MKQCSSKDMDTGHAKKIYDLLKTIVLPAEIAEHNQKQVFGELPEKRLHASAAFTVIEVDYIDSFGHFTVRN